MRGSSGRRPRIHGRAGGGRRRLALIAALGLGALGLWRRGHPGGAVAASRPRAEPRPPSAPAVFSSPSLRAYADGHARPRAVAVDAGGDRLYVAGSTADCLIVVDYRGPHPRVEADLPICAFPDALAPLPGRGVVVSCRFDPALRVVVPSGSTTAAPRAGGVPRFDVRRLSIGATHGHRGLALDPAGRFAYVGSPAPYENAGAKHRRSLNLSERLPDPVVGLDALAVDARSGQVAVIGAGSDNVVRAPPAALTVAPAVTVGGNPSALAFLPSGGLVTADRLGDTLSFVGRREAAGVDAAGVQAAGVQAAGGEVLAVGRPERPTSAERGEVMFYSRALVPHNVATGPLSLYTCAGCHPDGHVDGRRHPSKRNRFYSMTKTCRGLLGTEPFLSIGEPDTFAGFADNILSTHAQGALDAPDSYDQYPVSLRLRERDRYVTVTLSPQDTRAALAVNLSLIPVEPSPFVPSDRVGLSPAERRGLDAFRDRCSGCPPLLPATGADRAPPPSALAPMLRDARLVLTSALRYDVGTPVLGAGGNCPPSKRSVRSAAPYISDGSAT